MVAVVIPLNWDIVFLLGVILADVLLLANLIYIGVLSFGVQEAVGRILFGTLATLKLWVIVTLTYLLLGQFSATFLNPHRREVVRWGLLVYLLVQATVALAAWEYWRQHPDKSIRIDRKRKERP